MRLPEGQYVANFTVVAKEEEKEEDTADGGVTDTEAETVELAPLAVTEVEAPALSDEPSDEPFDEPSNEE
jgi:hypothetical protein